MSQVTAKKVKELKTKLTSKKEEALLDSGLSTGCTLLNLACSGRANFGLLRGHYYLFIGDSDSGKTLLTRTILAEAAKDPKFADYRLIFDDVEGGALMNTRKFFGNKLADRLEAPNKRGESSTTIEEFYYHVDDAINAGKPFIYVLDSIDCLSSEDETKKFLEHKKAHERALKRELQEDDGEEGSVDDVKQPKGSYGDNKAKKNSGNLRRVVAKLRRNGSILIIINQTRDNIGFGAMFNPKVSSGGHALKFYACLQLWMSVKYLIKRTVNEKERPLGLMSRIHIKRSRMTGRNCMVDIPIYYSYGMDDIGSMVEYLQMEKHWKGKKLSIIAPEFNFKGTKEKLIRKIETEGREQELRRIVQQVWIEIANQCVVERKKRYD